MKFWDATAVVPLLVTEQASAALLDLLEQDQVMVVWWGTPVECVSAIARREREAALTVADASAALAGSSAPLGRQPSTCGRDPRGGA